jgi:virulence-associated protein VagC
MLISIIPSALDMASRVTGGTPKRVNIERSGDQTLIIRPSYQSVDLSSSSVGMSC